ncbi:MAG: heavy metal translocating P-type ATPase [Clostridia bacterium]|nr:heavy metal translocating P-type ATPase [Clostridia bacterium]
MAEKKFYITGMTCSVCVNHVETAVKELKGVKQAGVNLSNGTLKVVYDETSVTEADIEKAVKKEGYGIKKGDEYIEEEKKMRIRIISSVVILVILMYLSMGPMINIPIPKIFTTDIVLFFSILLVLTAIIAILNRSYFIKGFQQIIKLRPNMDSLVAAGAGAAIIYGLYIFVRVIIEKNPNAHYVHDIYFESAAMILTLVTLGKYFETKKKKKTGEALRKLMDLTPKVSVILKDDQEIEVLSEDIQLDDLVIIRQGDSIPCDGTVVKGQGYVDQSSVTGEPIPEEKLEGDKVISGCICKSGYFIFKAEQVGENTTVAKIVRLVEDSSMKKAPIAKLADEISRWFVPVVTLIALSSFVIWLLAGKGFDFAFSIAISVLVISCPCALGLATPISVIVGTGKAAEHNILIKTGEALEILHKVDTVVLDKTGTITEGKPTVVAVHAVIGEENHLLSMAASLEKMSEHPLADAILTKNKELGLSLEEVKDFQPLQGEGVLGSIGPNIYKVGNRRLMENSNINVQSVSEIYNDYADKGYTPVYIARNDEIMGIIAIADVLKPESIKAIKAIKKLGINVIMLTGDNERSARAMADIAGVDDVIAGVLPVQKEQKVSALREKGKIVAMVGDGINDAPALIASDVGIAIGAGTDIAIESADVILMKSSLMDVVTSIKLSKKVFTNIKQNLFWAFLYNTISIPIAAGVFYNVFGWTLSPMIAAAAMSMSSISVVANALRLKRFKPNNEKGAKMKKEITIEGMSCSHCSKRVEDALNRLENTHAKIDLKKKTAFVETEQSDEAITKAVKEAGYLVKKIK